MVHHDVTIRRDGEEATGMQAIIWAFIKNPAAAIQIGVIVGGIFGIYYTLTGSVSDAKTVSEQHYKDLLADSTSKYERLAARIDQLLANDKSELDRIDALYKRGDDRYAAMQAKLSAHDVDIARIATGVDYMVGKVEDWTKNSSSGRSPVVLPRLPAPLGTGVPTAP